MTILFRRLSKFIFDQPVFYKNLRILFLGGLPTTPVLKLLEPQSDDVIIDVGCGDGFISKKISCKQYIGIDNDPAVIEVANRNKNRNSLFIREDIRSINLDVLHPTKAILYGVLHHLSNLDAIDVLNALSKAVSHSIITLDPIYSRYHAINNFLCGLDRGRFVRTEKAMHELLDQTNLRIETQLIHYANTKIAKYISLRLIPPKRIRE